MHHARGGGDAGGKSVGQLTTNSDWSSARGCTYVVQSQLFVNLTCFPYLSRHTTTRPQLIPPMTWIDYPKLIDHLPFYLKTNVLFNGGAILCVNEKVGSTAWMTALTETYGLCESLHSCNVHGIFKTGSKHTDDFGGALLSLFLPPTLRPRLMWVRNPYTRLLSAYLDKYFVSRKNKIPVPLPGSREEVSFSRMVEHMWLNFNQSGLVYLHKLNPHFSPLSVHCLLREGFSYDVYLKLEEAKLWLGEVSEILGLTESSILFLQRGLAKSNQAGRLLRTYFTSSIQEKVYEMFYEDFLQFGYSKEIEY